MKRYIFPILAILLAFLPVSAAETAQQTLDKAVARLKASPGMSADFAISRGKGGSVSGKIKSKGRQFAIVTPAAGAWYDGTALTTWSKETNEATVVTPTSDELRDTNPLLFLQSAADYTAAYGKSANASQKVLVLTPKRRGAQAKSINVTLSSASLMPQSIDIVLANGEKMKVTLRNLSLKATVNSGDFKFPKARYPKAKVVDLR